MALLVYINHHSCLLKSKPDNLIYLFNYGHLCSCKMLILYCVIIGYSSFSQSYNSLVLHRTVGGEWVGNIFVIHSPLSMHNSFFFFFKDSCIYLKVTVKKRQGEEERNLLLLLHCPDGRSSLGWAGQRLYLLHYNTGLTACVFSVGTRIRVQCQSYSLGCRSLTGRHYVYSAL